MPASETSYRDLEKKLKDGLTSVSADVVDKYGNLKLSLNTTATAKLIFNRLEHLEELSEMSTQEISKLIEETEKESPEMLAEIKSQVTCCEKLVDFIQSVSYLNQFINLPPISDETRRRAADHHAK